MEKKMQLLEDRIKQDGVVIKNEILKVDSFINHQIDVDLLNKVCKYLGEKFQNIDKIVTIETSGIPFSIGISQVLGNIPVVFAKKSKSLILNSENAYTSEVKSFTRKSNSLIYIDKNYLHENESCLIVDDFLAEGNAAMGLVDIIKQAKAKVAGVAIVIEKEFQGGHKRLEEAGYHVESAAIIKGFKDNKVVF